MKKLLIPILLLVVLSSYGQQEFNEVGNFNQLLKQSDSLVFNFENTKVNSPFTDDYNFQSEKMEEIKEIISLLYTVKITGGKNSLSRKQRRMYNSLVEADKNQIETIVMVRFQKTHNNLTTKRLQDTL